MSDEIGELPDLSPFGLRVTTDGDRHLVTSSAYGLNIMVGDLTDVSMLHALLLAERNRCILEFTADVMSGAVDGFDGDIDAVCDANVYPAGARSPREAYGDEIKGWSDKRMRRHVQHMLSFGVIGKDIETIDPRDTASSAAYTGFLTGIDTAFRDWLEQGHLLAPEMPKR